MTNYALTGAKIFDGSHLHKDKAFLQHGPLFQGTIDTKDIPDSYEIKALDGGVILPGFVDLQVNGGGGIMFNNDPSVDGLRRIAQAHATIGTRALLATLITDTRERTRAAVDAVEAAIAAEVPGILGIHLEGPHLALSRKGAHEPSLMRPMEPEDEQFLLETAQRLPNVMVTVALEAVSFGQIKRLSEDGIIVSIGHSDCSFDQAQTAFKAGASCVTHLFNAMSQLGNREPGLVGAALHTPNVSAGLIADDIHVHSATMRMALQSKQARRKIFLVTDSMAPAGSEVTEFDLNGRKVKRNNGRLKLQDGTLAGADLDFSTAISVLVEKVGVSLAEACTMATSIPAGLVPSPGTNGRFVVGSPAKPIYLDENLKYRGAP